MLQMRRGFRSMFAMAIILVSWASMAVLLSGCSSGSGSNDTLTALFPSSSFGNTLSGKVTLPPIDPSNFASIRNLRADSAAAGSMTALLKNASGTELQWASVKPDGSFVFSDVFPAFSLYVEVRPASSRKIFLGKYFPTALTDLAFTVDATTTAGLLILSQCQQAGIPVSPAALDAPANVAAIQGVRDSLLLVMASPIQASQTMTDLPMVKLAVAAALAQLASGPPPPAPVATSTTTAFAGLFSISGVPGTGTISLSVASNGNLNGTLGMTTPYSIQGNLTGTLASNQVSNASITGTVNNAPFTGVLNGTLAGTTFTGTWAGSITGLGTPIGGVWGASQAGN